MNVYIVTNGTWIHTVFAELGDAKAHVYAAFGVTPVYQGAGVWAAPTSNRNVWIRRHPVRGGR